MKKAASNIQKWRDSQFGEKVRNTAFEHIPVHKLACIPTTLWVTDKRLQGPHPDKKECLTHFTSISVKKQFKVFMLKDFDQQANQINK